MSNYYDLSRESNKEYDLSKCSHIPFHKITENYYFRNFFIEQEMNHHIPDESTDEEKYKLYQEGYELMYEKIKDANVASRRTIRRWFGLKGLVNPKRIHIFHIALAMQLSTDQLNDYLIYGIREPGIQINDYNETIYLYGIDNHLSLADCQDMQTVFEKRLYGKMTIVQDTHTEILWNMYHAHHADSKEVFLRWMITNAGMFKGYSKTTLHCFQALKTEILDYIRTDAQNRLLSLLKETDYEEWIHHYPQPPADPSRDISRYISSMRRHKDTTPINDNMITLLQELYWIGYSSKDKSTDLLAEVFAAAIDNDNSHKIRIRYLDRNNFTLPECISFMTEKEISQILGIAQIKEDEIQMSQQLINLQSELDEIPAYPVPAIQEKRNQIKKQCQELEKQLINQEQRCQLVQRNDLLPLIHYVAQRRYIQTIDGNLDRYDQKSARQYFINYANKILDICCMAPINKQYQYDNLLLHTFQKSDMYSLSDLIDEARQTEDAE